MGESMTIVLDQGPPTEEGWYFCAIPGSPPCARRVLRMDGSLGVAIEHRGVFHRFDGVEEHEARWSRRIIIQDHPND